MKTEDEVRSLKANWQADPIWDIENTEGFEDYKEELLAFRRECEEAWEKAASYRYARSTRGLVDRAIEMLESFDRCAGVSSSDQLLAGATAYGILAVVAELRRMNDIREGA